ncbi:CLUMA_CG014588, isoform A [Clunio marinus]|uniref:CLUMA_CG014588, isoform A n=1 Tax=Clunio marinus TaxID=568069 RepID=A0A1J1ISU3_9DIPT|nr:CLUMA_CG014588, isoform A [Clunio marinus]
MFVWSDVKTNVDRKSEKSTLWSNFGTNIPHIVYCVSKGLLIKIIYGKQSQVEDGRTYLVWICIKAIVLLVFISHYICGHPQFTLKS